MEKDTIEMRVHHLDSLRYYIKLGRNFEAIKESLLVAKYDRGVTEAEVDEFASNICQFYESILKGDKKIKLVSKPDGICNGECTLRKIGGCDLDSVKETDLEKAGIESYNVEIGKDYSLQEILKIMKDYIELCIDKYTRATSGW